MPVFTGLTLATHAEKQREVVFQPPQKIGRDWIIDEQEPVVDGRNKTGQYVGRRLLKKPADHAQE